MNKLFFLFIFLILISGCSSNESIEDMSAEQVLDSYLGYLNYNNLDERIVNLDYNKQIATGIVLTSIEQSESYEKQRQTIDTDIITLCNEAKTFYETRNNNMSASFGDLGKRTSSDRQIKRTFEVLSKEVIEDTPNIVKIKVIYKMVLTLPVDSGEHVYNNSTIYILKKGENGWKLDDVIEEGKELFSKIYDLEKQKQIDEKELNTNRDLYLRLKEAFDNSKKSTLALEAYNGDLNNAVTSIISTDRVISMNLADYNNQSDKYVFSVTYYYKDETLVDEYLTVEADASDIFEKVFPLDSKIYQVQVESKQKYKDDYGNEQEKYLSRISMNRETYNKINWNGFESSSLDSITPVSYYGDSFYKSLKDIQDSSKQWQDTYSGYSSGYPSSIDGAPVNMCSDIKQQCEQDGDCETYDMLKSLGQCN